MKHKKDVKSSTKPERGFYKTFKKELPQMFPIIVMWNARLLLVFQSYMYHGGLSIFHLCWVLCSFLFPAQYIVFFSIVVMLPLYTTEFIFVYGSRIAIVAKT